MLPEDSNCATYISSGKGLRQPDSPLCSFPHAETQFLTQQALENVGQMHEQVWCRDDISWESLLGRRPVVFKENIIIGLTKADIIGKGWSNRLQFGGHPQALQIRNSGHDLGSLNPKADWTSSRVLWGHKHL